MWQHVHVLGQEAARQRLAFATSNALAFASAVTQIQNFASEHYATFQALHLVSSSSSGVLNQDPMLFHEVATLGLPSQEQQSFDQSANERFELLVMSMLPFLVMRYQI